LEKRNILFFEVDVRIRKPVTVQWRSLQAAMNLLSGISRPIKLSIVKHEGSGQYHERCSPNRIQYAQLLKAGILEER